MIDEQNMLNEDGFVVAEHDKAVALPEAVGALSVTRRKFTGLQE